MLELPLPPPARSQQKSKCERGQAFQNTDVIAHLNLPIASFIRQKYRRSSKKTRARPRVAWAKPGKFLLLQNLHFRHPWRSDGEPSQRHRDVPSAKPRVREAHRVPRSGGIPGAISFGYFPGAHKESTTPAGAGTRKKSRGRRPHKILPLTSTSPPKRGGEETKCRRNKNGAVSAVFISRDHPS